MTNVLVVSPSVTNTNELEVARNAVAGGVRKTGEVLQNYADMLCKYLDLKDAQGNILGAAGASGGTGDEDEACCAAGIEKAGLKADVSA